MKPATSRSFVSASDELAHWRDKLLSGSPPVLYQVGSGELSRIEVGPERMTLIGGPPGAGKTAFTMQLVLDALRITPELRALVCNVEMSVGALFERQLARLSGVPLDLIRYRKLTAEHEPRIAAGLETLEALADRLAFVRPPFTLESIADAGDEHDAALIVLDYIQRIPPPGDHADKRGSVDASMNYLRQFADEGRAVIVVSAVGRGKDSKGRSSYAPQALSLASFRESSELEFGCDDAFILANDPKRPTQRTLMHLKCRHGEARDIELLFDGATQRFHPLGASRDADPEPRQPKGPAVTRPKSASSSLAALWDSTPPAPDDAEMEA